MDKLFCRIILNRFSLLLIMHYRPNKVSSCHQIKNFLEPTISRASLQSILLVPFWPTVKTRNSII